MRQAAGIAVSAFVLFLAIGCVAEPDMTASGRLVGGDPKLRSMIGYILDLHKTNVTKAEHPIVAAYYSASICPLTEPFSMAFTGVLPATQHSAEGKYEIFVPTMLGTSSTGSVVQVLVYEGQTDTPKCVTTRVLWDESKWTAKGTFRKRLSTDGAIAGPSPAPFGK